MAGPKSWPEIQAEDRRLVTLRLLVEARGSANESELQAGVYAYGHRVGYTRRQAREDLQWLERHGLLATEMVGTTMVATLSERGADVARGDEVVDGVKCPALGSAPIGD